MAPEGFKTITISVETDEKVTALKQAFQPKLSPNMFILEMAEFYEKYHCPECGQVVAEKKKHHRC